MQILVVDDQELNRTMLQFMLESEGFKVSLAADGEAAIESFKEIEPDIILLDVVMPKMDGYTVAPILKKMAGDKHLPIIFITALDDQKSMLKCLEVGGDDFLAKPFDKVILSAKIKAHSRSREQSARISKQNAALIYHQNQTEREHQIVEHIFSNALKSNNYEEHIVRHHLSPASMFNGDLFLTNRSPMGGAYILLGDFTGHGLAAAVGALPTAQTFFTMTAKGLSVGDIAQEINLQLLHLLPDDMFCAACIVELSSTGKTLSLWSGGMPDSLLLSSKSGLKKRIPSQHMALGILEANEFDNDAYHLEVTPEESIILYTDGVIEASNESGDMFGQERLEACYQANPTAAIEDIIRSLKRFSGTAEQEDDVSIAQIHCLAATEVEQSNDDELANLPWQFQVEIGPEEIKSTDPVSHTLDMVSAFKGVQQHRSALFLLLAELYNNALDHGLLNLDSSTKNDTEDGFFQYYCNRQEALDNLNEGLIRIEAKFLPHEHILQFTVQDSGQGFDYQAMANLDNLNNQHGRGVSLINEICHHIEYSNGGSTVVVQYKIDQQQPTANLL
ncbi:fused response regulator/phosphatase [Catenovulum sp. SM1970]|uniref:fused response regulator/phosphatase n=1 Tax=Marinifaba aquimaris TaxID=2741323 RepID=UPI001573DC9C|nr:fused response regulator/phosphatase [Marinifaba aquimaris]NTS77431.1 fused response regulator/phosphatase [Marinifaba aquimaris]